MGGWIKLHRKILKSPIWKDSTQEQKIILITLLLMANHEEKEWVWRGKLYKVTQGQFITSLKTISEESGTSIQNIRTALKKFELYNFLTNTSTNRNRLITIVNWQLYQGSEDSNQQADQQATNKQLTNKLTTNKNIKNNKNIRNKENIYSLNNKETIEEIWSIYPEKKGKQKAIEYIEKILNDIPSEELKRAIKRYMEYVNKQRQGGFDLHFQHGSTFFKSNYVDYLDKNYSSPDKAENWGDLSDEDVFNKIFGQS